MRISDWSSDVCSSDLVGFGEVLQERYFGELNARQQEYVDAIVHASQDLRAMINDILDLASIEAGYMTLDPKPVAVADLMTGLEAVIRARAGSEERRVGKGGCRTGKSRWARYH